MEEIDALKRDFENLKDGEFVPTSRPDSDYNCVAWAAGETVRNWWPEKDVRAKRYWPKGIARVASEENFAAAFRTLGYSRCESADLEPSYEKVAHFVSSVAKPFDPVGTPTHMAIQLPDGKWSSKLGISEDISHDKLDAIGGWEYGKVKQIYKRKRKIERVKEKK